MPSLPRYCIIQDGDTFHAMWQCHNKDWLFKEDWAKKFYYHLLCKFKDRYQVQFYGYTFMDNHVHLTGILTDRYKFSDFFRTVNSLFAREYNRRKRRCGQVVMDRFKSPSIQTEADLMRVMVYIDLNQKRAAKVVHPKDNRFSSYGFYASSAPDRLITAAPAYLRLGATNQERQIAYILMVEEIMKSDWREKKPYSSNLFIGDPNWVEAKLRILKEVVRKKRLAWKMKVNRLPNQLAPG